MEAEVYKAIVAVQAAMAKHGISKDRTNAQQGYKFRGIDDVYSALSPALAVNGLCFLPRVLSRQCEERQSKSGGVLNYVTVACEFDLVSAADGSKHTICTYGEAMDSADKATNKAMSAAYKYAAMQAFCIPVEGEEDADASTHEVKAKPSPAPAPAPRTVGPKPLPPVQTPAAVPSASAEELKGTVEEVKTRNGEKNGKAWTSYSVKISGEFYSTFSDTDGANAQDWKGQEVFYTWKPARNPQYRDLVSLRRVNEDNVSYENGPEQGFMFGESAPA